MLQLTAVLILHDQLTARPSWHLVEPGGHAASMAPQVCWLLARSRAWQTWRPALGRRTPWTASC